MGIFPWARSVLCLGSYVDGAAWGRGAFSGVMSGREAAESGGLV